MKVIKINKDQWNAISEEGQKEVLTTLIELEVLEDGDTIVGDPEVAPVYPTAEQKELYSSQGKEPSPCFKKCDGVLAACMITCASTGVVGCEKACDALYSKCIASCL